MRIAGADSWVQEDRWEARGSMPGSYGLPTITDDQGGHIAYVVSAEHAKVLAAALEMRDVLDELARLMDSTPGAVLTIAAGDRLPLLVERARAKVSR